LGSERFEILKTGQISALYLGIVNYTVDKINVVKLWKMTHFSPTMENATVEKDLVPHHGNGF
jgi:hypothetical protein